MAQYKADSGEEISTGRFGGSSNCHELGTGLAELAFSSGRMRHRTPYGQTWCATLFAFPLGEGQGCLTCWGEPETGMSGTWCQD
ncbi:MAG: hypothetical protein IPK82_35205 [Polyangiaceae bacterium]|nr:hypothetical protein [Polyangiaceae bacterium]